jgi:hypothetical protein
MTDASTLPVVRHFIVCTGVWCDTSMNPNRYTIENPLYAMRPPSSGYPFRASEIWLFCQFSDTVGRHTFHVDLSWDIDRTVRPIHSFAVDFGADRLAVRNFAVRLRNVPFLRPGVYEFRLRHGNTIPAQSVIRLEEVQ